MLLSIGPNLSQFGSPNRTLSKDQNEFLLLYLNLNSKKLINFLHLSQALAIRHQSIPFILNRIKVLFIFFLLKSSLFFMHSFYACWRFNLWRCYLHSSAACSCARWRFGNEKRENEIKKFQGGDRIALLVFSEVLLF